jgi:hypothetical protein
VKPELRKVAGHGLAGFCGTRLGRQDNVQDAKNAMSFCARKMTPSNTVPGIKLNGLGMVRFTILKSPPD